MTQEYENGIILVYSFPILEDVGMLKKMIVLYMRSWVFINTIIKGPMLKEARAGPGEWEVHTGAQVQYT